MIWASEALKHQKYYTFNVKKLNRSYKVILQSTFSGYLCIYQDEITILFLFVCILEICIQLKQCIYTKYLPLFYEKQLVLYIHGLLMYMFVFFQYQRLVLAPWDFAEYFTKNTLFYIQMPNRTSHQNCSLKQCSQKFRKIQRKTLLPKSLF